MEQQMSVAPTTNRAMEPGPFSEINRTGTWRDYLTVTKLGITLGNMIAVFAGFWLGTRTAIKSGWIPSLDIWTMVIAMVGTALVIMAGTSFNNYIDRNLDQQMERTRNRPSATGALTPQKVLIFGIVLAVTGTTLLLFVNLTTALLGLAGLFFYVVVYTMWLKRTSSLSTVIGGISGAIPPIMGYAAGSTGILDASAWVIFTMMFLWQPPHFLALAIRRVEDYRAGNIPLLPVLYGFDITKRHSLRYVAAMVPVSFLLYGLGTVGLGYLIVAIILGIGYLYISVEAFYAKDDTKWAIKSFRYSLLYCTIMYITMIISAT